MELRSLAFGAVLVLLVVAAALVGPGGTVDHGRLQCEAQEAAATVEPQGDPIGNATVNWYRRLDRLGLVQAEQEAAQALAAGRYEDAVRLYDKAAAAARSDALVASFFEGLKITGCMLTGDRASAVGAASRALPTAGLLAESRLVESPPVVSSTLLMPAYTVVLWKPDASAEELGQAMQAAGLAVEGARRWVILQQGEPPPGEERPVESPILRDMRSIGWCAEVVAARARARAGEQAPGEESLRRILKDCDDPDARALGQYCLGRTLMEAGKAEEGPAVLREALSSLADASARAAGAPRPWLDWLREDIQQALAG